MVFFQYERRVPEPLELLLLPVILCESTQGTHVCTVAQTELLVQQRKI